MAQAERIIQSTEVGAEMRPIIYGPEQRKAMSRSDYWKGSGNSQDVVDLYKTRLELRQRLKTDEWNHGGYGREIYEPAAGKENIIAFPERLEIVKEVRQEKDFLTVPNELKQGSRKRMSSLAQNFRQDGKSEKFGVKVANFVKGKSLLFGAAGAVISIFAPEIGIPIMAWEGIQWLGANWYVNRSGEKERLRKVYG